MKICAVDSFPNHKFAAEREFISRLKIAGARLGIDVVKVETSDQIIKENPSIVLATHEFTAKLMQFTTLGLLWSPPDLFANDIVRTRNILSYDGYLVGSNCVQDYLLDVTSEYPEQRKPIADFLVLPTCQKLNHGHTDRQKRSLFYSGVHWDGNRHGCLFHNLDRRNMVNVYGPPQSWSYIESSYRGIIPFDGSSLFEAIANHGISLCLHKKDHILADTPSMRLFEAAAVGSVIIADEIPFAKREFGDSIFVIDANLSESEKADFIEEKVIWIRENSKKADQMAAAAQEIFNNKWSLDVLLPNIIDFGQKIRQGTLAPAIAHYVFSQKPTLDVIIRCGSRPVDYVKRAIESVLAQEKLKARVLLVDFTGSGTFKDLANEYGSSVKYVPSFRTGFRSSSLWDGLKAVEADYFALLDDDDTVEKNHWSNLIAAIETDHQKRRRVFAYSGVIRMEEDGAYVDHPSFNGDHKAIVQETRELKFLDLFDPDRLLLHDNYIQSNAWVAKTSLLQSVGFPSLEDPRLHVAEDVYLYLRFLSVTDFIPVFTQTANWHWRSLSAENSMISVSQAVWRNAMDRSLRRLEQARFRETTFKSAWLSANAKRSYCFPPAVGAIRPQLTLDAREFKPSHNFSHQCEANGFYDGGAHGAWTEVESAEFACNLAFQERQVYIELDVKVAPRPSGEGQAVKIMVNQQKLYDGLTPPWQVMRLCGVLADCEDVTRLRFQFILENCFNPLALGQGDDSRDIGLLLMRVRVMPVARRPIHFLACQLIAKQWGLLSPGFYPIKVSQLLAQMKSRARRAAVSVLKPK